MPDDPAQTPASPGPSFPGTRWTRQPAGALGLDEAKLDAAGDRLAKRAGDRPYRALIVRRGAIVWERFAEGIDPNARVRQASAAKSVYSSLLAIAVAEGRIASADARVRDDYPAMLNVPEGAGPKPGRYATPKDGTITFRQLISNTSGYLKPDEPTGEVFHYQTYGMNIFCHALASAYGRYDPATGSDSPGAGSLIAEKIRDRIGGSWTWAYTNFDLPAEARLNIFGNYTQLDINAEDMARLGWLWVNGGRWADQQVVPADWLAQATTVVPEVRQARRVIGAGDDRPWGAEYGYGFWSNERGRLWPSLPRDSFAAHGAGSKLIWCCPSLELVAILAPGVYRHLAEEGDHWLADVVAAVETDPLGHL